MNMGIRFGLSAFDLVRAECYRGQSASCAQRSSMRSAANYWSPPLVTALGRMLRLAPMSWKGGSRTFAASANTTLPDQGSGRSAGSRSRTPVHLQEGRRAAVRCDRDECPVRGNLLSAIVDKVFAWQYGRISQIMGQRNGQPPSAVTSSDRASLAAQGA